MLPEQGDSHPIRPEPSGELTALEKRDIEAFEFITGLITQAYPQLYQDLLDFQRILDSKGQYFSEIVQFSAIGQGLIQVTELLSSKELLTQYSSIFVVLQSWLAWAVKQKISSAEDQIRVVKKLYVAIDKRAGKQFEWRYITFTSILKFIEDKRGNIDSSDKLEMAVAAEELAAVILKHQSEIYVLSNIVIRDQVTNYINHVIKIWAKNIDTYIDQRTRPIIADLDDSVFKGFSEKR